MIEIIEKFLLERKNDKIKEKTKSISDESEKQKIIDGLEEKFALKNWLPDAAKRASQLSLVSHPAKFSHPNAKTSSIIAKNKRANDGYIRSGNVDYELDVFGNAAALDVYKFLTLKTSDSKTILEHLEENSKEVKVAFLTSSANYDGLREGFLEIKKIGKSFQTNNLVKQIYFPVHNSYHLLSILTPSGLISKLKNKLDKIRFSEDAKQARKLYYDNKFSESGFDDFYDLTVIGYGGTKPQNISVLNNQNGGKSYLLSSLPPQIEKKNIRLPKYDFFKNSLWLKSFEDDFKQLDKLLRDNRNNIKIRDFREALIKSIIDKVLDIVFKIREFDEGWSQSDNYKNLSLSQKTWLDNFYLEKRENEENWVDDVSQEFAVWIIKSYENAFKDNHEMLSSDELDHVRQETKKAILITRSF